MQTSNRLTAADIKSKRQPGKYADGNCLYLVVTPTGAKHWVCRTVIHGRRRDVGLGSARFVTLADAREATFEIRKVVRAGGDPVANRRSKKARVPTFQDACEAVFEQWRPNFCSAKHTNQWIESLRTYAYPLIAKMPVDAIETRQIYGVLHPIWATKPETARRLQQRLSKIFEWCKAQGYLTAPNPVTGVSVALGPRPRATKHLPALHHSHVPRFVNALVASTTEESTKLGLLLVLHTALRTSEVRLARWNEIDWNKRIWTIPSERQLKKKKPEPHHVPLTPAVINILTRLKHLAGESPWLFPGRSGSGPICDTTLLVALKQIEPNVTVHGFRSTFRTWVEDEVVGFSEAAEAVLAHTKGNKVEAAYRRGDLWEKRCILLNRWSDWVLSSGQGLQRSPM